MKRIFKSLFGKVLYSSKIIHLLRNKFPNKDLTVLMYHHVDPKYFEEQVKYIKEYYNPISEKQLYDYYYNNKSIPKNSVLLTFDDGYYNNYKYAYPILKKYQVPAVTFLVTGLIGKQIMPWYDKIDYIVQKTAQKSITINSKIFKLTKKGKKKLKKECYYYMINVNSKKRNALVDSIQKKLKVSIPKKIPEEYAFMNWNQVKEIQDIFAIGSHTFNHPILANESKEEQEYQIKKSYEDLKKKGIKPVSFCYPNGDYSTHTIDIVKKYFKIAYSTNFGRTNKSINRFLIQRVGANIQDNKNIIAVKLTLLRRLFNRNKKRTNFKVIQVTNYYFPQTGGITTSVHTIKKFLNKKKIPVSVIPYPYFFRHIENFLGKKTFIHKVLVIVYAAYLFVLIGINRIRYKNIVIHSHSANFCAQVASLGKFFGAKTIHTFHTDPHMNNPAGKKQPRPFLNRVHMLSAVSNKLAKDSKKIYGVTKPIEIIFNSVNAPLIKPSKKKREYLEVTMVAHLLPIKDPLLFIQSIEELSKHTKVKARIIGDGPLRNELQEYITTHKVPVTLEGSSVHEKTLKLIANSDVFALTSKGEGLGTVLLEAMTMQVPVVATNVGGISEIVHDNNTGVLINSRNPKEVAKGILKAAKNRKKFIANANVLLKNKFDMEENMHKYVNMYCYLSTEKIAKKSEK